MQSIQVARQVTRPIALDNVVKAALPGAIGLSTGWYGAIAHLPDDAPAADRQLAADVLNAYDTMTVNADKATIQADGTDTATITCDDAAIAGDADFSYTVWLDGEEYDSGTDVISGGVAMLTLATNVAGTYEIEIRRNVGDFASGYVQVEAQ